MSGDVTLIDSGDGSTSRLVYTASTLFARPGFGPAALVGGLAVTMRLATVHRATNDVDTVTDGDGPRALALEYLGDVDARDANRVEIDGVKVDVMPTFPLPAEAGELPDDDLQRLFLLGHRWALDSADELSVTVVTDRSGPAEPVALRVATAPALVACKFHAIADRRDARSEKRESDALDLVRLIGDLVRTPAAIELFSSAPFDLAALVSMQAERWLITDATRMSRLVHLSAGPVDATMEAADIATIGSLFVEMSSRR
ncbi:MAG: nucleotidyl transferase AbiEii/AbiGii toxin family protein [Acidimicrobiales bacterium]